MLPQLLYMMHIFDGRSQHQHVQGAGIFNMSIDSTESLLLEFIGTYLSMCDTDTNEGSQSMC